MDMTQLEYFLAIATEGSFSRAARALSIAQPSLSQQMKRLEKELGQQLFDRLPRGVVLTSAGKELASRARLLVRGMSDARQHIRDAGNRIGGTLAVGAIPTIAPYVLPQMIPGFVKKYPGVSLTLREDVTTRLISAVEDGSLDLAIMSTASAPTSVHLETIAVEPLLAAVQKNHKLAGRKNISLDELFNERMLVLQDMHCLAQQVSELCLFDRATPSIVLRGEHLATIGRLVDSGLGISIVPAMMARHDRPTARKYIPLTIEATRPIILATSLLRYRSNAMRAFVETIRATLRTR